MRWLVVLLCLVSVPAWACEEFQEIENAEVQRLFNTMQSAEATDIARMVALETLVCAKRPHVRNMALKTGLTAQSEFVRSLAMTEALMDTEILTVEFDDGSIFSSGIVYKSRETNCLGFDYNTCGRRFLTIDGVRVTTSGPDFGGVFKLNAEGNLVGQLNGKKAKIVLNER